VGSITVTEEFGTPQRYSVLRFVVLAIIGVLFIRMYMLQLFSYEEYAGESEKNSVRMITAEPVRGYIFDRNGKLVVDDGPSFTVTVTQAEFFNYNVGPLATLLDVEPQVLQDRINRGVVSTKSRFTPVKVKRDIDFGTLSSVEEHMFELPGVSYDVESKRIYVGPARSPHLLGYCKEIGETQMAKLGERYRYGDLIGFSGIESSYEQLLRGEKGKEFISVNAKGQVIGRLEGGKEDITPKEGFDLILSADFGVQALAESLMTNYKGALVAIDPQDGGVLAMVSTPDYDPSVFSGVTSPDEWNKLNDNPDKPLFNRATMTLYPPGSTFKMVLAAAALEDGIIDKNWRVTCPGGFRFGNRFFKCTHVHGSVNVVDAIDESCNTFFYQLVLKVGLDRWTEYAKKFGFGKKTLVDIDEEAAGLIPSTSYYDRVYGNGRWTQGLVVNLGIGQGELGVSPMQMAQYAAALANGGIIYQPRIVHYIRNKATKRIEEVSRNSTDMGISPKVMALIREGMRRCVEVAGGTGSLARIPGVVVAGKTGTAENPHGEDHAWFVGFAPFDHPRIAVACIVENAGFGGTKAAPICGQVMERYLLGAQHQAPEPSSITASRLQEETSEANPEGGHH
jgi:penicillin-binding protein 2